MSSKMYGRTTKRKKRKIWCQQSVKAKWERVSNKDEDSKMLQSYRQERKQSSRESRIKINFIIRGKKTQKRNRMISHPLCVHEKKMLLKLIFLSSFLYFSLFSIFLKFHFARSPWTKLNCRSWKREKLKEREIAKKKISNINSCRWITWLRNLSKCWSQLYFMQNKY